MGSWTSLTGVVLLGLIPIVGVGVAGFTTAFAVVVPYAAVVLFVAGFVWRVVRWAMAPVPFRIPTVCGQARSLAFLEAAPIESPSKASGVVLRLAGEILVFRSLLRDAKAKRRPGGGLSFLMSLSLWLGAMSLHWMLLIIVVRHLRLFVEPVPGFVNALQWLDTILQSLIPALTVSDLVVAAALLYLLLRRVLSPQLRGLSLPADYLALFLLIAIVASGMTLVLWGGQDVAAVKSWVLSMAALRPRPLAAATLPFYVHLFYVAVTFTYFPVSKLMHMPGIFLSPTRNLANDSRARRHVNPWNSPVEVHTYADWEDEFRESMKGAGMAVDKE